MDYRTTFTRGVDQLVSDNRRPAVEEPANDFERVVNDWADLQDFVSQIKALLKPIEALERRQRDAVAESLTQYFGDNLKEGVNRYTLSNERTLKLNFARKREVDTPSVDRARKLYTEAATGTALPIFDDLLRVKYELAKTAFNKLPEGSDAKKAAQTMLVTKPAASTLEVD